MIPNQKDRSQSENPANPQGKRVQQVEYSSIWKWKIGALGGTLSPQDAASFRFSFELASHLLLRDRPCSSTSLNALGRLCSSVLSTGDVLGFIETCSQLRSALVHTGSWELAVSKPLKSRWMRGLSNILTSIYDVNLVVHPSHYFDSLTTFLGWFKRLPVCIRPEKDAVDAYLQCDERISSISFDENMYVPELRKIWVQWFKDFKLTGSFLPRHGPGSTADAGRVQHDKWRKLGIDTVGNVCMRLPSLKTGHGLPIKDVKRISKVVFVPKQAGKSRTICMEPAWLQYLQQGVADQLRAFCSTNHPLARLVNINVQDVNRRLCAEAMVRRLSTLDLSDASDSVSTRLIRRLCKGLPLWRYLYGSRSFTTTINGVVYEMDKFAPMGSALCFPIECYLFASVVELAYRMHYDQASEGHFSGCSVYGDDIICPEEIYHLVVDILSSLGFLVNESKSCPLGPYYESCGVEYLHGVMINSIKHPRSHLLSQKVESPERVGLITDLANSLYLQGYFHARRFLLKSNENVIVRVGSKEWSLLDLMVFDGKHCFPVQMPYHKTVWSSKLHTALVGSWSIENQLSQAPSDYLAFQHGNTRRDREQRLRDLYHIPIRIDIHPKWSQKAVIALAASHQWDLLKDGDIQVVGRRRTGRPRCRIRRKLRPAV